MKYYLLGKSGLRVAELALGAMSFGTEWGWGIDINEARKMLDLYIDNGGNFVDTANFYTNGSSEKMLGEFLGGKRQQIVLSTKYTMNTHLHVAYGLSAGIQRDFIDEGIHPLLGDFHSSRCFALAMSRHTSPHLMKVAREYIWVVICS